MKTNLILQASNAVVKTTLLFTALLSLLFFADYYERFELVWIGLLLLTASITNGLVKILEKKKE